MDYGTMFGSFNGTRQATIDQNAMALSQLQQAKAVQDITQSQWQFAQTQRYQNFIQQVGPQIAQIDGAANQLNALSQMEFSSGMVDKAQKSLEVAATLQEKANVGQRNLTQAKVNILTAGEKQADLKGQLFGSAQNQADWDAAQIAYAKVTGELSGLPLQFDPKLASVAISQGMTSKQQTDATREQLVADSTIQNQQSAMSLRETQKALDEARKRLTDTRADALIKAGAGLGPNKPGAPIKIANATQADKDLVVSYLKRDNITPDNIMDVADMVVSQANAIRAANPAILPNIARHQAYEALKANGAITHKSSVLDSILGGNKTGALPELAAPLPMDKAGKLDRSQIAPNKFYAYQGKVWRASATGLTEVPQGAFGNE